MTSTSDPTARGLGSGPVAARRIAAAARVAALLAAIAAALLAGCSVSKGPTGIGDASGFRLGVFASDRGQPNGQYDIFLFDYDALTFKALTGLNSTAAERHPSLSSDGRFIAFQVNRGTGASDDIVMYDRLLTRGAFVDLPGLNTGDSETEPRFTGDGLKLCFVQGTTQRRVRLYDGQTKQLIPLPGLDTTAVTYSDYSPSPNNDGSIIAFVSDRSGNPDIYIYDRTHKAVRGGPKLDQALRSGGEDVDPYLTSNGRFLAFSSTRSGTLGAHDIYLLEMSPSGAVPDTALRDIVIANGSSEDRHPAVNETGYVIVFQSDRTGGQGRWDLLNFNRSNGQLGVGTTDYDSPADDIEPSIKWPY
jgi:Tol biopolymer transport system component